MHLYTIAPLSLFNPADLHSPEIRSHTSSVSPDDLKCHLCSSIVDRPILLTTCNWSYNIHVPCPQALHFPWIVRKSLKTGLHIDMIIYTQLHQWSTLKQESRVLKLNRVINKMFLRCDEPFVRALDNALRFTQKGKNTSEELLWGTMCTDVWRYTYKYNTCSTVPAFIYLKWCSPGAEHTHSVPPFHPLPFSSFPHFTPTQIRYQPGFARPWYSSGNATWPLTRIIWMMRKQ